MVANQEYAEKAFEDVCFAWVIGTKKRGVPSLVLLYSTPQAIPPPKRLCESGRKIWRPNKEERV